MRLEGFDSDDVTAQHYNTDPRMLKKREMMRAWIGFLDKCEAAAVARDPWLHNPEIIREKIYRKRYKDEAWKRAIERSKKSGKLPWQDDTDVACCASSSRETLVRAILLNADSD